MVALSPAILVGHSMGGRVVIEAAMQATDRVAGVVLVDGSQFAPAMEATLNETFATRDGYSTLVTRWFQEMFTTKSKPVAVAAVVERAGHLPKEIGARVLLDMARYDTDHLAGSLGSLRVPVMAIQTTYSNERRERRSMSASHALSGNAPSADSIGEDRDHRRYRPFPADR